MQTTSEILDAFEEDGFYEEGVYEDFVDEDYVDEDYGAPKRGDECDLHP